jgi:leucine dehydrogenase
VFTGAMSPSIDSAVGDLNDDLTVPGGTEQLVLCRDRTTGLAAVIAIDDTTLGPALGGVRYVHYASEAAAIAEVRRLARVMTLKNACADIPYGGGKSVMMKPSRAEGAAPPPLREDVMRAFGRFVGRLGGAYVPGVDMGTTVADLATMREVAPDVSCDHVDPSPYTALGVMAALEAGAAAAGFPGLAGLRVLVQGAGHVGRSLALRLAEREAVVMVADIDAARASAVAKETAGTVVPPEAATSTPCDVLAPCAAARVIDGANVDALPCRVVVGAANDVLAHRDLDRRLAARGVLYVPDFVANAGGVVEIHAIRSGWDEEATEREVLRIGTRVEQLLAAAGAGRTPLEVAEVVASDRLGRDVQIPS